MPQPGRLGGVDDGGALPVDGSRRADADARDLPVGGAFDERLHHLGDPANDVRRTLFGLGGAAQFVLNAHAALHQRGLDGGTSQINANGKRRDGSHRPVQLFFDAVDRFARAAHAVLFAGDALDHFVGHAVLQLLPERVDPRA